jgi:plasmid stability protein
MGMIQIRNVPPDLHRKLKAKAAKLRMSLSEYLLEGARERAEIPTPEEIMARLAKRKPIRPKISSLQILREERDRE